MVILNLDNLTLNMAVISIIPLFYYLLKLDFCTQNEQAYLAYITYLHHSLET